MQNKNKIQSDFLARVPHDLIFACPRLVFFAEAPKIGEGEVADVVKKEEEGPALDVAGMVNNANGEFNKYQAQLQELPQSFSNMMHDEVVRYMRASPGRFEKDDKAGLSSAEFEAYRGAMVSKVQELLKEYAPTEEDLKQIREAKAKSKEATAAAEKLQPIEAKDVSESPGAIPDLQTLDSKFQEYNNWNAALQQEASSVLTAGGAVQTAYAAFKKARDGISSYKKFTSYLFPENDAERIALQDKIAEAKTKLEQTVKKYRDSKAKLDKYSVELAAASNNQKQERIKERDDKIRQLQERTDMTDAEKKEKEDAYRRLESQQKSLEENRDKLDKYRENAAKGKDVAETREDTAKMKKEQLGQCYEIMANAAAKVDEALLDPNLTDEERQQLEETAKQIREKRGEIAVGLNASDMVLLSSTKEAAKLADAEREAGAKSLSLKRHLDEQVTPAINMMDGSIANLEQAKMECATTKEQVMAHYEKMFQDYDKVDEAVDNAILKNNLANEQMIGSLEAQQKSLGSMDVAPPSGISGAFEATAGVVFGTLGGLVSEGGEWLLDQATWLSNSLENSRQDMGTFSYVMARIGVEVVSSTIGVAGGLVEMAGGLVGMIAHPINTAQGLGALVGLNPDVSAGKAWGEMGKALISWEDFKHGRIGVGIGKMFVNIVTTATGAGAAGAGGKAGAAAYTAARVAGKGVAKAVGKATIAGGKAAAGFVGREIVKGAKVVPKMVKGGIKGVKAVPSLVKAAPGAARGVVSDFIKEAKELRKMGKDMLSRRAEAAAKAVQDYIPGSARSAREGMSAQAERILAGSRPGNQEELAKLKSLMDKEGGLVDDLAKDHARHQEYMEAELKLFEENPNLTNEQLRLRISEQNMDLYLAEMSFRKNFQKLREARSAFDDAMKAGIESPENIEKMTELLKQREVMRESLYRNGNDYQSFRKLLASNDPTATEAMRQFMKTVARGDRDAVMLWAEMHAPAGMKNAFNYMASEFSHGKILDEISLVRETERIIKQVHELSPEQIGKILRMHPDNYEHALELYRKIPEQQKVLEAMGLRDSANELANLDNKFSAVDGISLATPEERLAYFEKLKNMSPLELEWYRTRPPKLPASKSHPQYADIANQLKEFSARFITEKLMPDLVARNMPFEDLVKELHKWQTMGSSAQMEVLRSASEGYNIAGRYRNVVVRVGAYWCPEETKVPGFMKLLSDQVEQYSAQMERMKAAMTPQAYESAVIQYAAHVLQRFVEIHPMRDGNGRTARMLYNYIVSKHLGAESRYRNIPMGVRSWGESTLHPDLMEFNGLLTARDYPGMTGVTGMDLEPRLRGQKMDNMMADPIMRDFAHKIQDMIDNGYNPNI
jgi:hypothetical protein